MSTIDSETQRLMDEIYISKVLRAQRRSISEKILDGPRLFDECCQVMRGGIRSQFPEFTDEEVEKELRRRLKIRRQIDEAGIYRNVGAIDE